jgi:carboxymethylenebutenolidase
MAQEHLASNNGILSGFVSYSGGEVGSIDGYIALPNDRKAHPGVILIQEWWGIEPHIQELTQRLAREGYVVLAPDLFHGKVATEPDEAMKATMALNRDAAVAEVRSGIDYLQRREDVLPKQVGVVGFCMGGLLVWRIAELENGELAAIAPFYAAHYHPSAEDIARVSAPALVVWGQQDASISAQDRQHITQLLQQQGKTHQALVYPAGHAFMNDRHGDYNQPSAEQAWSALLAWFKQYLR